MKQYSVLVAREWSGLEIVQVTVFADNDTSAETQAELIAKSLSAQEWKQAAIPECNFYAESIQEMGRTVGDGGAMHHAIMR